MLVAGYQGVVGTMWSINDSYAPKLAEDFYRDVLARGGEVDGEKRPHWDREQALHHAVQGPRNRVGDTNYAAWAPYAHFGL